MIQELREKTNILLDKYLTNNNQYTKLILIKDLLKNDNLFFEINIDYAMSILNDLEYDYDQSLKIYSKLININEYKNNNE